MTGNEHASSEMKRKTYEKELRKLQVQLCHLQEWVKAKKLRVIIVLEGRDAAGKGGTIKAITEKVSPPVFRVVALPAPSDREKSQLFMQRYIPYLPAGGEVVIFDRSWYNRAGVERVMGFCTDDEARRFLALAPNVEKAMVDGHGRGLGNSGVRGFNCAVPADGNAASASRRAQARPSGNSKSNVTTHTRVASGTRPASLTASFSVTMTSGVEASHGSRSKSA